jgi:hypothetical protein
VLQGIDFKEWCDAWEPSHRATGDVASLGFLPYKEESDMRRVEEGDGPWPGILGAPLPA